MHDARARLAGWMNACDRPASQRAHGWLAGWRILTEDYIPMHERPGSRARVLKVVCKSAESLGGPHLCQPFTYDFHSFLQILVLNLPTSHRCMGKRTIAAEFSECHAVQLAVGSRSLGNFPPLGHSIYCGPQYIQILSRPFSRSECRWAGTRPDLSPTVKNEFFEFSCMRAFCL